MSGPSPVQPKNPTEVSVTDLDEGESSGNRVQSVALGILGVLTWLVVIPRAIPSVESDPRGIYVTVAERLIGGQALYREVWDNKDPLFFYSIAVGRLFGPWADAVLEVAWLTLACIGVWLVARWAGLPPPKAIIVGFIVTPIVLTGNLYIAGYTHLPALAISLLALAASVHRREILAGVLLALTWYLNIRVFPIALTLVLIPALMQKRADRLGLLLGAFIAGLVSVAIVMQMRGELVGYLEMLLQNARYSNSPILLGDRPGLIGHFERTMTPMSLTLVWLVLAVAGLVLVRSRMRAMLTSSDPYAILWTMMIAVLFIAMMVILVTGLWPHHGQVLYIPILVACVLVMTMLMAPAPSRTWLFALSWICAGLALAGVGWRDYLNAGLNPRGALSALARPSTEAQALLTLGPRGTYARVGMDVDRGHGFGTRGWSIACPKFHQYPFDPPEVLARTLRCVSSEDTILVSGSLKPQPWNQVWNDFVTGVETQIADHFLCREIDDVRICTRERK